MKVTSAILTPDFYNTSLLSNEDRKNWQENARQINLGEAVKVSLSREGMEQYRNLLIERDANMSQEELDDLWFNFESIKNFKASEGKYVLDVAGAHYSKMRSLQSGLLSGQYGVEDVATAIMSAYATVYADIVKGHEDGSREVWTSVPDHPGPKKLTLEEDLALLDEAYEKCLTNLKGFIFATQCQQNPIRPSESLLRLTGHSSQPLPDEKTYFDPKEDEDFRNKVYEKMQTAQKLFKAQYPKSSVNAIMSQVFHSDSSLMAKMNKLLTWQRQS